LARWCGGFPLEQWKRFLIARRKNRTSKPFGIVFLVPQLLMGPALNGGTRAPMLMLPTHLPLAWHAPDSIDYRYANAFLQACNNVLGFDGRRDRKSVV